MTRQITRNELKFYFLLELIKKWGIIIPGRQNGSRTPFHCLWLVPSRSEDAITAVHPPRGRATSTAEWWSQRWTCIRRHQTVRPTWTGTITRSGWGSLQPAGSGPMGRLSRYYKRASHLAQSSRRDELDKPSVLLPRGTYYLPLPIGFSHGVVPRGADPPTNLVFSLGLAYYLVDIKLSKKDWLFDSIINDCVEYNYFSRN